MHNKVIKLGKEIAEQITISFFISSIVVLIVYFCFYEKIDNVLSLVNMITITEKQVEKQEVSFDAVKKRLAVYPTWGSIWATIEIPKIKITAPVFHGVTLDIIKYGVGHYSGSYFPGEGGSIILAAHNSRQHFMYIPNLQLGDEVIIKANYGTFTYKVIDSTIIGDRDMASLPIQKDKEILMMYTCWPVNTVGFKSKRYVVYTELVGVELNES